MATNVKECPVPGARLRGGVWLPETEEHFVDWMKNSKRAEEVDGKRTYQMHKIRRALDLVPEGRRRTYVDVGAHVGLWAMWISPHFEKTEAFEPVELHHDIFPYNMPDGDYKVRLYRCGLGDPHGPDGNPAEFEIMDMEVAAHHTGSFHVHDPRRGREARADNVDKRDGDGPPLIERGVTIKRLDSFKFDDVDLIKIDVEGWELPVVKGAASTIVRCRPVVVVEQKGNGERGYGHEPNAAVNVLRELGMEQADCMAGDYFMTF